MNTPPPIPDRPALFLDFDGTLVELAATPDAVQVPAHLADLLERLTTRCDGALAFVTGRSIADLDALLGDAPTHAAGVHGAEWRLDGGDVEVIDGRSFADELEGLTAFASAHPALVMERKSAGATLHYRRDPALEQACRDAMAETFGVRDDFETFDGHMMVEARRVGIHKGAGIERLMPHSTFVGRTPVFIGDDRTDEDGFGPVNDRGGVSIRVGPGDTAASHRLPDIAAVYSYLERFAEPA